jgi:hypothetical protein
MPKRKHKRLEGAVDAKAYVYSQIMQETLTCYCCIWNEISYKDARHGKEDSKRFV